MPSKKLSTPTFPEMREYQMTISRMTIDKLGVKLYDRVYAVIAELISNSYDADATKVIVRSPMDQYLAKKANGKVTSLECEISVEDDGHGMTPEEVQEFFLVVGKERRNDNRRGDTSPKFHRKVMGRKGIGKLAPFGVCGTVELISAGGKEITKDGNTGFLTAHIILEKNEILNPESSEKEYRPKIGEFDQTLSQKTFTKVILRNFEYRRINSIEELSRQLAQRFGIQSPNWEIVLEDSSKQDNDTNKQISVGELKIDKMSSTVIEFEGNLPTISCKDSSKYSVKYPKDVPTDKTNKLFAGFEYEKKFYPIVGWIGYSKEPYKDDLMSGVRIYCRGKFAAQTNIFNRKAGFTGEYNVRSYLVGAIHADWLDEDEDLIHTDRRDILWSHEIVTKFQEWGQKVVEYIGHISRIPIRKSMAEQFFENAKVEKTIQEKFPNDNQNELRQSAKEIAEILGKSLRGDELNDTAAMDDLVQLSILIAPIQSLDKELRKAIDADIPPLRIVNNILKQAKLAETVTLGKQISQRIKIIEKFNKIKDDKNADEKELQSLIYQAPWLISPQWRIITANQTLKTFISEFQKYCNKKPKQKIHLVSSSKKDIRPDFVFFEQDSKIQLIEIKKPKYTFVTKDMNRLQNYVDQFNLFFNDKGNVTYLKQFPYKFHITLICDKVSLNGTDKAAFDAHCDNGILKYINWASFLLNAKQSHQEFLDATENID